MSVESVSRMFDQTPHPASVDDEYHVFDRANILNVEYWSDIFREVQDVDYETIVECGVGRGRSLITIAALAQYKSVSRNTTLPKIFAFDSFQGFPQPSEFDRSWRNPRKGEWSTSPSGSFEYSPNHLRRILSNAGIAFEIEIVEGFFEDTLQNYKNKLNKIGILHLDADLYSATKTSLECFAELLVKGGVIVIDDYEITATDDAWPGCRKAVSEFMQSREDFVMKETLKGSPKLIRV